MASACSIWWIEILLILLIVNILWILIKGRSKIFRRTYNQIEKEESVIIITFYILVLFKDLSSINKFNLINSVRNLKFTSISSLFEIHECT